MVLSVTDLRARLEAIPGIGTLLPVLPAPGPSFYLVGGAVRDLLLGKSSVDLDVAVEGDAVEAAIAIAEQVGGTAIAHERFGTATLRSRPLVVDLATTRREIYPRPGALPVVEPASLHEDLRRRDFSVNAMAIGLSGDDLGQLHDPSGGREDLDAEMIRILHPASFLDDPTRLLRGVRYESRLAFSLESRTEELAREAATARALDLVSGVRIQAELMDLLAEHEAPRSVQRLAELGLDRALLPGLVADPELVAGAKLGAIETGAEPTLAALAALITEPAGSEPGPDGRADIERWVGALGLPASERDAVLRASSRARSLAAELRPSLPPSELRELLDAEPPEALAMALALGAPAEPVLSYIGELRGVRLEISGADLLAAGLPESPALGRALRETLHQKLDGRISGREEELRTALRIARDGG
jgi:tRNA nucleotidyltransferase (CCA-adding enzyme)